MIEIFAGRRPGRCALHVAGHAGHGPRGQDVVCAGVSALTNALAGTVSALELTGAHAALGEGEARITCAGGGVADALFYEAVIELAQIARSYPDCVHLRTEGYFTDEKTGVNT